MIIIYIIVVLIVIFLIYSFFIEPYLLQVRNFDLNKKTNNELKILHLSDIHIKKHFNLDHLKKIIDKINEQDPDVVIFTGDLYDNYSKYHDDQNLINLLKQIKAGTKLAVSGNHDYFDGNYNTYLNIMKQSGFTLLENSEKKVTVYNKTISFIGLPDIEYNPKLNLPEVKSDYKILLSHEPEAVDKINGKYDLILSGHSHGGQIFLYFIPIFITKFIKNSHHSFKYVKDFYNTKNGRLYVNSGIGTTRIPARFGVIPSITLFHMYF